jgi:hypothetical protein
MTTNSTKQTEIFDDYYPLGVHVSIWNLPKDDIRRQIAKVLSSPFTSTSDSIDDITIVSDDDRVAIVSTCGHGYMCLAKQYGKHRVGTCIGDEDEGMEKKWMKILEWNNPYSKNGEKMEDEEEEDA